MIKTFHNCVISKTDVCAIKIRILLFYSLQFKLNKITIYTDYGELKLELKFIRVAMPLRGRSKQKLHHSIASYFIPFNQVVGSWLLQSMTIPAVGFQALGYKLQKISAKKCWFSKDILPERIYNSHYSNGVPAMFNS